MTGKAFIAATMVWAAGAIALGLGPLGPAAQAQSLTEALALTYQTNPQIAAQREAVRGANEEVPQALGGMRPTVTATGSAGVNYQSSDPGGSDTVTPATIGVTVTQPLYTGGQTEADLRQAENFIQQTRAILAQTEQSVFLSAVTAYMDIVQNEALLELQINNERVLSRQLQAARDRFDVGEVTRTDVSQAESRLAGATADRIQAAGALRSVRATYEQIVGSPPGVLTAPPPLAILPGTLDDAMSTASDGNPSVIAAVFAQQVAEATIDSAEANLLPDLTLQGSVTHARETSTVIDSQTDLALTAQLTVPIYQAGIVASQVREARYAEEEARINIEDARRVAIEDAVTAWENLTTSRAQITSVEAQVVAAQVALDGVQQEALVGSRTTLDVLDAEQELLDARVALVIAQRNEVVAQYTLLAAIGGLTAEDLSLPVDIYDPDPDYTRTSGRLYGTSIP